MTKLIETRRMGNEAPFAEGNEGTQLERACFEVADALFTKIQTADLVTSFFVNELIVPDGESPHFNNAVGPDDLLTQILQSDNKPTSAVIDLIVTYKSAHYGFKDDNETGFPNNPNA